MPTLAAQRTRTHVASKICRVCLRWILPHAVLAYGWWEQCRSNADATPCFLYSAQSLYIDRCLGWCSPGDGEFATLGTGRALTMMLLSVGAVAVASIGVTARVCVDAQEPCTLLLAQAVGVSAGVKMWFRALQGGCNEAVRRVSSCFLRATGSLDKSTLRFVGPLVRKDHRTRYAARVAGSCGQEERIASGAAVLRHEVISIGRSWMPF